MQPLRSRNNAPSANSTARVLWLGENAPPAGLGRILQQRGYALEAASDTDPPPLRVTDLSFARSEKRPARKALADWRVAVAHSDPGVADGMAQTLRAQGAVAAVVSLSELGQSRIESLQPHVALVDPADLDGRGVELLLGIWSHRMLRWTPVLLTPATCFDASGGADFNSMLASIDGLTVQTEDLMRQARSAESFTLPLSMYGPALTLRALVESGRTLSAHFETPEITIDVDVAEGIVVGAQRHGDRSRILGPRALAVLTNQTAGHVRVERRDRPAMTNIMAPLETALSAAASESASLPPPVNDNSIPPPDRGQTGSQDALQDEDEDEVTRISEMASMPKPLARNATPTAQAAVTEVTAAPARMVAAGGPSMPPVGKTLLGMTAPVSPRRGKARPPLPSTGRAPNDAARVAHVDEPDHEPGTPTLAEALEVPVQLVPADATAAQAAPPTSTLPDAPTKTVLGAALGGLILLGIVIAALAGGDDAASPVPDATRQTQRAATGHESELAPAVAAATAHPVAAEHSAKAERGKDTAGSQTPTPAVASGRAAALEDAEEEEEADEEADEEDDGEVSKGSAGDRASALVSRGNHMLRAKRYGGARASYLKALQLVSGYPRAIEGMTQVHLARHEAGSALKMAKALVRMRPKRARHHRLLGDAYAANGDFSHAQKAWKHAARRGDRVAKKRLGM